MDHTTQILVIISEKGNLSVDEYFLQMRTITDGLQAAGHLVANEDLVLHLLAGLGTEFDVVFVNITTRDVLPSINEVQSILQAHEMRIQQLTAASSVPFSSFNPSANFAQKMVSQISNPKEKPSFRVNLR